MLNNNLKTSAELMIQTSFNTIQKYNQTELTYEPPHAKTNKMRCAPSEDAYQPGHPHIVGQGPVVLAAGAGRVSYIFFIFFIYLPFLMSCLLGDG